VTLAADLVLANRILVDQGVLDAFGHVSARLTAGTFLLARNRAPGLVVESDLIEYRFDGSTDDPRVGYLERFAHAEIYRARPEVGAIVHSHSPSVVPLSTLPAGLRPLLHMAGFLGAAPVPVFEMREEFGDSTDLLITSTSHGRALADTLGERAAALMRGHGAVVVGSDLPTAVFRAVYTELNAQAQVRAMMIGQPNYLTPGEARATSESIGGQIGRAWDAWGSVVSSRSRLGAEATSS